MKLRKETSIYFVERTIFQFPRVHASRVGRVYTHETHDDDPFYPLNRINVKLIDDKSNNRLLVGDEPTY